MNQVKLRFNVWGEEVMPSSLGDETEHGHIAKAHCRRKWRTKEETLMTRLKGENTNMPFKSSISIVCRDHDINVISYEDVQRHATINRCTVSMHGGLLDSQVLSLPSKPSQIILLRTFLVHFGGIIVTQLE